MKKIKGVTEELKLEKILYERLESSEEFHKKTRIKKLSEITDPATWPEEWKKIYYKSYPRFEELVLPKPSLASGLKKLLESRISKREYGKGGLSLGQISSLLNYSAGIKNLRSNDQIARRYYPSPGARYPLEIYVLSLNSVLPEGVYHYYVKNNSLEKLAELKVPLKKIVNQRWIEGASILICVSAVFLRTNVKYSDRGYRHIMTEYGLLLENFYLIATSLGLSCCAIGGFIDDQLHELIDVNGIDEAVVGLVAFGKQP